MRRLTVFLSPIKQNLLALAVFLLLWSLASLFFEAYIVPSPLAVAGSLNELCDHRFVAHLEATLPRAAAGFALSLAFGTAIGTGAFALNGQAWIETLMVLFQVLPGLVLGIVLLMVFGACGAVPVCLVVMLTAPLVAVNTARALTKKDLRIENVIRSFGGGKGRLIRDLYIPSLVPTIRANTTLALVMSIKIVLLGEFIACENGLGYLLNVSRVYFNMREVFFYILVILLFIVCCQVVTAFVFTIFFEKYLYPG